MGKENRYCNSVSLQVLLAGFEYFLVHANLRVHVGARSYFLEVSLWKTRGIYLEL